jgi:hypothetical protein
LESFALPPCQVDLAALPPVSMTSEAGSFAYNTLKTRVPAISQETIRLNTFPTDIRAALHQLYDELTAGTIRGLREDAADRAFWDAVCAPWLGRSWLAVPWYWAEAYFYRRILEATRYFQPGPWRGFDPYAIKKRTEWAADAAPQAVGRLLRHQGRRHQLFGCVAPRGAVARHPRDRVLPWLRGDQLQPAIARNPRGPAGGQAAAGCHAR